MADKDRSKEKQPARSATRTHRRGDEKEYEIKATNLTSEDRKFLGEHKDDLSRTTLRAKWVHSPDEHEDRPGQSLATQSREVIQAWAEERGAQPTTVPDTRHGNRPGVLRFNFPGYGGQELESIDWEDWFKTFEERDLVFVFQEHKKDGSQSNFFIFDNPERERG